MALDTHEKSAPWCTICLVVATIVCHTLVLMGNLNTSKVMKEMGESTSGWSNVGIELAETLNRDMDNDIAEVTKLLTNTLSATMAVEEALDAILEATGVEIAVAPPGNTSNATAAAEPASTEAGATLLEREADAEGPGLYLQQWLSSNVAAGADKSSKHCMLHVGCIPEKATPALVQAHQLQGSIGGLPDVGGYTSSVSVSASAGLPGSGGLPGIGGLPGVGPDAQRKVVELAVQKVSVRLNEMLGIVKPALQQVGEWTVSFGDKVQPIVDTFTTTLDKAQKLFDSLMTQVTGGGPEGTMIDETFGLFAVGSKGSQGNVTKADIQSVATLYGITALAGKKGEELFDKYDENGDGNFDRGDFMMFIKDESIPDIMSVVLRQYSKKLSQIAGNLGAARMRDEIALSVSNYLTLVCSKNMTKVGWVAERLTNASVPVEFTADILVELALQKDDPNKLTDVDVGVVVVSEMVRLNHDYVGKVLQLINDPTFWASEGHNPTDQPDVVQTTTEWFKDATESGGDSTPLQRQTALLAVFGDQVHSLKAEHLAHAYKLLPTVARHAVELRSKRFRQQQLATSAKRQQHILHSKRAQRVLVLFGGALATHKGATGDQDAQRAVSKGVPAVASTLEFAKFLAWNATNTSATLDKECFDYSKQSSSKLDSFATQMKNMVKQVSNFVKMMEQHSSEKGIKLLEQQISDFQATAVDKIMDAADNKVSLLEEEVGVSLPIIFALRDLNAVIPTGIDSLKFARQGVSKVSSTLKTTFTTFGESGPPIFHQISSLWKTLWTAYFVLFAVGTSTILLYGFYAAGHFRSTADQSGYVAPVTFRERLGACCGSCTACLESCHNARMCFWSCVILFEVVCLVLFVISIVLCLLAGIKAFLGAGCSQIYILGDDTVCTDVLGGLRGFLGSFWMKGTVPVTGVCSSEKLMTCKLIESKMMSTAMLTVAGSLLAAVLSFQMIINAGILYEQASWVKKYDEALTRKEAGEAQ